MSRKARVIQIDGDDLVVMTVTPQDPTKDDPDPAPIADAWDRVSLSDERFSDDERKAFDLASSAIARVVGDNHEARAAVSAEAEKSALVARLAEIVPDPAARMALVETADVAPVAEKATPTR